MGKFKRVDTSIDGVCVIEPTVFGDNRGYFMETYNDDVIKILEDVKDYDIIHFFWRKTLLPVCDIGIQKKLGEKNIDIRSRQTACLHAVFGSMLFGIRRNGNKSVSFVCF